MIPERRKIVSSALNAVLKRPASIPEKLISMTQHGPAYVAQELAAITGAMPKHLGVTVNELEEVFRTTHFDSCLKRELQIPSVVPTGTFYHHYKHNPSKGVRHYAYELIGVGVHTEDDCRPEDANMVVYRPLYVEAAVFKAGRFFDLRPLEMWMGNVNVGDESIPRFQQVLDPTAIAELALAREEMYGEE